MYTDEQKYGLITKPEPEKISRYDLINKPEPDELYHWGIKGMKWGVRRYQNKDGSLTQEGKRRHEEERKSWTRDPKKFAMHYDDLTPEERNYAIQRRRDIKTFADTKPIEPPKRNRIVEAGKTAAAAAAIAGIGYKGIKWLGGDEGKAVIGTGKGFVKKAWKWATSEPMKKAAKSKTFKKAVQTGTAIVPHIIRL